MKKNFNKRNSNKKGSAGYQKKTQGGNQGGYTAKRIDVDSIYRKLKASLNRRAQLQTEYDKLWDTIKRTRSDRTAELKRVDTAIGKETHTLNQLLSQLCQYRKTHRAMNLAYDSIGREITRIQRIIDKWQRVIYNVDYRGGSLLNSRGETHTNTSRLKRYVAQKQQQLSKLRSWQSHVARYRVA